MKTITFIIPSKLQSQHLLPLLDFLIEIKKGDVILVDNSTWTPQVDVEKYKHCITILHRNEWGVSYAKNQGAQYATSDYLYFLDDDVFPYDMLHWIDSLSQLLEQEIDFACVGGNVYLPCYFTIPHAYQKYSYFYGEKLIWCYDHFTKHYFWWANQIFQRSVFYLYWGFPENFGHREDKRRWNEEVFLQELLLKDKYKLFFKSWLAVVHYGARSLSEKEFIMRLKEQGRDDYFLDKQISPYRLRARILKYSIVLFFQYFISCKSYDAIRYKSYLSC